ncbi:NACHT domain-containing protein [Streptomyces boncukensis]|uniref:NACHT domain-containing protein n=1 Tax=Streptomyces boncukensis TaxID=2711219 RepID=A0A6G4X2G5_9ACTN|nr:NACHT domain-containing protein [Streptomyces boncukensis]NGO71736.1 NACHT domain-containing protein [Streptomyces boncukensis]
MEPSTAAARLATSALAPLVRKLFTPEGPGAGLAGDPVRMSRRVSFRGEQRTLTERDLHRLAADIVRRAAESGGPAEAPDAETRREVTEALAAALHSLGDLDMDDIQAVRLGPEGLAARLACPSGLSEAAQDRLRPLLRLACTHIVEFFTRRTTFVPRTLVEQTRALERVAETADRLAARIPAPLARDLEFERGYAEHIARRHGELTIYGLDLQQAREWRLEAAYVSLQTAGDDGATAPVPADEALAGPHRVLLRGAAGSGKSTLVQWLAVTAATSGPGSRMGHLAGRVPFVLPLRRIVRQGGLPTPDEFLSAVRSSIAGEQPDGWANRVLRAGRGLLLVDGVDEIPQAEREAVRRWMRELLGDYPGNLWLVTARPSAVRESWLEGEDFAEFSLAPLSGSGVVEFVRRWHAAAHAGQEQATSLLDAIRRIPALGRLAVNPLMCGLLCALHRERRGFLPHGRKDLYEAALSMLLERRDVERGVADGLRLSKETQIQLLQKLAHWLLRNDRAELERPDAVGQLERALVNMAHVDAGPERVYRCLLERSGLLREPADGRVDFVHRTFQDYLAAKAAVEEGDFPLLTDNAHRDQWDDVLRMAVALARPAERARILEALVRTEQPRQLLLAASCLDQATELAPGVRERVLSGAARRLPLDGSVSRPELAAAGPVLLELLPGPEGLSPAECATAVVAASLIATDAALPVLARFRGHPSLNVRRQLAWAWFRFDTHAYAAQILAHLDASDLYFTAYSATHLDVLRALDRQSRVQLWWPASPEAVAEHLDARRVRHLWLPAHEAAGEQVDPDAWRAVFPELRTVSLSPHGPRERT